MSGIDEAETVAELDQSHNEPPVYEDNGKIVYRASSVGGSTCALLYARLGYTAMPPPATMQVRFNDGHLHEPDIIRRMAEDFGWLFISGQDEYDLTISDRVVVRCHIDARMSQHGVVNVVEVKALSQSATELWLRKRWGAYDRYAIQMSVEMLASGLPGMFVVKDKNSGQLHLTEVPTPPVSLAQIKARVTRVEALALAGTSHLACEPKQWPCPFWYIGDCGKKEAATDARDAGLDVELIDTLAEEFARLKDDETRAKSARSGVARRLKMAMGAATKVSTPGHEVTWVADNGRNVLNKARLEEKVGDLTPFYDKTQPGEGYPKVTPREVG